MKKGAPILWESANHPANQKTLDAYNLNQSQNQAQHALSRTMGSEKQLLLKLMPLCVKDLAMKLAFDVVGERTSCLCLSNMGAVELP